MTPSITILLSYRPANATWPSFTADCGCEALFLGNVGACSCYEKHFLRLHESLLARNRRLIYYICSSPNYVLEVTHARTHAHTHTCTYYICMYSKYLYLLLLVPFIICLITDKPYSNNLVDITFSFNTL